MRDRLQTLTGFAIFAGILLAVGFIASLFVLGATAVTAWLLPKLVAVGMLAALYALPALGALAIIPPARGFAGMGMFLLSFLFGAILWAFSLLYVMMVWGGFAVVLGLMVGGIGVVPMSIFAALFRAEWGDLGLLLVALVLVFGLRIAGAALLESYGRRCMRVQGVPQFAD